ncbi:MAG: DUF3667 domain-containing protein [Dysgonamonadaceae bacterium]|jgi:hypothetical protein|nr:DUF3667 domain-containing protein [Dysgonamonadaceae bacterium]
MSHSKIRKDKRCQNCGYFVATRFCPECGQENVETRRHFHYLFVHFWADFIHYDGLFWKTVISLFFPAKLTKEYLAGKRKSQVNPVQLYIFISFVVFFIPAILPDFSDHPPKTGHKQAQEENIVNPKNSLSIFGLKNLRNIADLDSIQRTLPEEEKLSIYKYAISRTLLGFKQEKKAIKESLKHNFPKAVFLYMPVFAFWLWLFHSKKKWLYFDHGVYTLHYFSLILFITLLHIIVDWLLSFFHTKIHGLITLAIPVYLIYYFFHSHRLMYRETKTVSRLMCTALFIINTLFAPVFLVLYVIVVTLFSAW